MSEKNSLWKQQQDICSSIYEDGFARHFQGLSRIREAFQPSDRAIRCIDDGTPGGIHLAGSGILLSLEEAGRIISEITEVDGIYSHENCEIAALEAERVDYEGSVDELSEKAAKELAAEVNIPYLGEISADNMSRPVDFHSARAIYYDGTGDFDWSQVEGLPTGFTISRKYIYSDYAKEELGICIDIAFGERGFGARFDSETPLLIVIFAENHEELEVMQQEIRDVTKHYDSDRIQIDTYIQA
ncbi:MAG: hypothetical protein ABEJ02_00915 [Candidatus Paceibacteria bacterium]